MSPASLPHSSVRASALAMLADGNSPESVAHLLEVPIDVVQGWQIGQPDEPAAPATPRIFERSIEFDSALEYRHPFWARVAVGLTGLFAIGLLLAIWYADRNRTGPTAGSGVILLISLFVLGVLTPVLLNFVRSRFVFGRDGLTDFGAISASAELRYSDIVKTTIVKGSVYMGRGARAEGHRVTFESSVHAADPMSVFILDMYPLDVGIVERLRRLPGVSERDLAPLMNLPVKGPRPVPKWFGMLLVGALLAFGIGMLRLPDLPFQKAWRGQPSLQQMTRVAGELRGFSGCNRDPLVAVRAVDARLRLDDGRSTDVWIPCVLPTGVFADRQTHRLSVDSWRDRGELPIVYQVMLDDRVLLAYDTVRGHQTALLPLFFLMELMAVLLLVLFLALAARLLDDDNWSATDA